MSGLWRRWVGFWARKEAGTSLALVRIAMGLCVLISVGAVVEAGLVDVLWVGQDAGGVRDVNGTGLINLLGGPSPAVVWRVVIAALIAGAALTVGAGGRLTAFVTLQLCRALFDLNSHAGGAYDELLLNGLWLLVLGPSAHTLSVDCKLRTGRFVDQTPVGAGARTLLVVQLVLMYWSTGLQKVSADWTPGGGFSALYYILQQPTWQRFDMSWVAWLYPVTQVGTAVSWSWEVFAPLWLLAFLASERPGRFGRVGAWLVRWRVREAWALVGLVFHVGIWALMEVGPFSPVSLAFYVALVHPWEWRFARGSLDEQHASL